MILLYGTIARKRCAKGEEVAGSAVFTAGYVIVWALFSLVAVALQYVLEAAALLSPMITWHLADLGVRATLLR